MSSRNEADAEADAELNDELQFADLPEHVLTEEREQQHLEAAARMRENPGLSLQQAVAAKATVEATMTAAAALAAKRFADDVHEDDEADDELISRLTEEAELASEAERRARAAKVVAMEGVHGSNTATEGVEGSGDVDLLLGRKEAGNGLLLHAEKSTDADERQMLLTKAETAYSKALEADPDRTHPSVASVLANRAYVRLRLAIMSGVWSAPPRFRQVVEDCDTALELQPGYVKARYRRARARIALACPPLATAGSPEQASMLESALDDLRQVLLEDPSNADVRPAHHHIPLACAPGPTVHAETVPCL
jgi:tetratricopeptide (TPR) repeat protein